MSSVKTFQRGAPAGGVWFDNVFLEKQRWNQAGWWKLNQTDSCLVRAMQNTCFLLEPGVPSETR